MRRLLATLFCAAMLFGATSAQAASPADAYPSGPISLVVCYTPGGATDLQARLSALVAQDPKYFGQPIVILNKPGAGGMTGWNWIMERGSKDGLTMTAYNMPHFIAQSIVNKTKFSVDTFEPLGNWGATRPSSSFPRTASSRTSPTSWHSPRKTPERSRSTAPGSMWATISPRFSFKRPPA